MYFSRGLLIFAKFCSAGSYKLGPALLGWPDAALYLPSWELWQQAAITFWDTGRSHGLPLETVGDTTYLGIGLNKIYKLSGSRSGWKSSICNFALDTANPSKTEIVLYTLLTDTRKGESYSLHTIYESIQVRDYHVIRSTWWHSRRQFLESPLETKISFCLDWSLDSEQSASQYVFVKCGNIYGFLVVVRKRACTAEARRNMEFVRVSNTWTEPITPRACSRTRFQPVIQVADGLCNNI